MHEDNRKVREQDCAFLGETPVYLFNRAWGMTSFGGGCAHGKILSSFRGMIYETIKKKKQQKLLEITMPESG